MVLFGSFMAKTFRSHLFSFCFHFCDKLLACLVTRLWLLALLFSLIPSRWAGLAKCCFPFHFLFVSIYDFLCGKLLAWLFTEVLWRLLTLLLCLITRRWVGLQTKWMFFPLSVSESCHLAVAVSDRARFVWTCFFFCCDFRLQPSAPICVNPVLWLFVF